MGQLAMPMSLVSRSRSLPSCLSLTAILVVMMLMPSLAAAQCALNPTNQTVTICTPADGEIVSSPVHVVAAATDSNPVSYLQIYRDGVKVFEVKTKSLDTTVIMT